MFFLGHTKGSVIWPNMIFLLMVLKRKKHTFISSSYGFNIIKVTSSICKRGDIVLKKISINEFEKKPNHYFSCYSNSSIQNCWMVLNGSWVMYCVPLMGMIAGCWSNLNEFCLQIIETLLEWYTPSVKP